MIHLHFSLLGKKERDRVYRKGGSCFHFLKHHSVEVTGEKE